MDQPSDIMRIYDNGGKTLDRYTFYFDWQDHDSLSICLSTSVDGHEYSQFSHGQLGRHNGKIIKWEDVPPTLQKHVIYRLQGAK